MNWPYSLDEWTDKAEVGVGPAGMGLGVQTRRKFLTLFEQVIFKALMVFPKLTHARKLVDWTILKKGVG